MSQSQSDVNYLKDHIRTHNLEAEQIVEADNENGQRPYQLIRGDKHPPTVRVIKSINSQKNFPLALITDIDWEEGVITLRDSRKAAVITGRNLYPLFNALSQYKVASIQTSDITQCEDVESVFIESITFLQNED